MEENHIVSEEFGRRAHTYDQASWVRDDRFMDFIASFGEFEGTEAALEVGIGTGRLAKSIRERVGTLIGVDISRPMMDRARRFIPAHQLICCDIEQLSSLFLENTFDVVYCRSVLHHVDIPRVFKEIRAILKPSGRLLIAETVSFTDEDEKYQLQFLESLHLGHKEVPTLERFTQMVEKAGFSIRKTDTREERASLENILSSTAKTPEEKQNIFAMLKGYPEKVRKNWNIRVEGNNLLFTKKWSLILACRE